MSRMKEFARSQFDITNSGFRLSTLPFQPCTHTDNSHFRHIPFQQGIGRLGRAVCNESHLFRLYPILLHYFFYHGNNSGRHTFLCVVGGWDFGLSDNLIRRIINDNRIRKGSSYVNPYSHFSAHQTIPFSFCLNHSLLKRLCSKDCRIDRQRQSRFPSEDEEGGINQCSQCDQYCIRQR